MAILGRLFGRAATEAPASAAKAAPKMTNVEFVGSFMLIQFYDGHHWQMSDETLERYASSAGPELKDLMRFWTLMYLAFMFRWCIHGLLGAEFEKVMISSLYGRLKKIPTKLGEFDIGITIEYWMDHLDVATRATGTQDVGEHKDVEFPACYFAGLAFLKFDPGSPFYMREDTPQSVTAAVVRGLARVQDEMLPHVRNFAQRIEVP
jgi:hypothetical protein